jgi:hypothetical protein
MTPSWLLDAFAALMLTVAALSAARIVASHPWRHRAVVLDTDVAHLLMAIAMAGMLSATLQTLPNAAWAVVFALLTAWFAVRVARDARATGIRALVGGHCAPHLVHSGAMLYMFVALGPSAPTTGGGMAGMSAPASSPMPALEHPTLAFALGLMLAGYAVWDLDHLSASRSRALALTGPALTGSARNGMPLVVTALAGSTRVSLPRIHSDPACAATTDQAAPASSAAVSESGPVIAAGTDSPASPASCACASSAGDDGDAPPAQPPPSTSRELLLSAEVTVGCRIAMGVTMALMLFVMI